MISFFKKLKENKLNKGMSYVELIVVLSIFSVLAGVSMYSYGSFQAKVDIKNLANDIALKIVQAQKDATSGELPPAGLYSFISSPTTWKPAYGLYFNTDIYNPNRNIFYRFVDIYANKVFEDTTGCATPGQGPWECLEKVNITKGNTLSSLKIAGQGFNCSSTSPTNTISVNVLSIVFTRSDGLADLKSDLQLCLVTYAEITVISPKGNTAKIGIYNSGRVQIN